MVLSERANLKFRTRVDNDGAIKDLNDLKKRMGQCIKSIESSGKGISAAYDGASSKIISLNGKIRVTEMMMESLQAEMEQLAQGQANPKYLDTIKKKIEETEDSLDDLLEKRGRLENAIAPPELYSGMDPSIRQGQLEQNKEWIKLTDQIGKAENKLAGFNAELRQAEQGGMTDKQASEYQAKAIQLEQLKYKLAEYKKSLISAKAAQDGFNDSAAETPVGMRKTKAAAIPLTKSIWKLGNMFKLMLIRMAIRAVISGAKEGLQNLAQYSEETNQTLSELTSGMAQTKNSFATAFSPILTMVLPALTQMIDMLVSASSAVSSFFAALRGKSTYTKAVKVQQDYAASLKKSASSASDLNHQLYSFDKLSKANSQSSGSGSSDVDAKKMFADV